MKPGPNQKAYDAAYTEAARRVYDICGSEAENDEVARVIDTHGINLVDVSDRDIWDAATEGAPWPHDD